MSRYPLRAPWSIWLTCGLDSGSTAHLTVQSSNALGQSANWANHNLYALQQHDTEPKSAYAFNSHDPHNPAVNFDDFFDGESLDQEDIVLYVLCPPLTSL